MKTLLTTLFVTLALVGCSSSAQLVRKDAVGGRVALQGPFMSAMGDARVLMADHCNGRFEAVEQGQSVEFHCRAQAEPGAPELAFAPEATPGR